MYHECEVVSDLATTCGHVNRWLMVCEVEKIKYSYDTHFKYTE